MRLISRTDHEQVERGLALRLREALRGGLPAPDSKAIGDFVLAGGKRIRPQLTIWTWRQASGRRDGPVDPDILKIAIGWELFHAFLLIHDDLIDSADVRRDLPALQHALASLHDGCGQTGASLAIVAGDLLFAAAMSLWHELALPDDRFRESLKLFSRVASLTGLGQAIDILQQRVPLEEVAEETLLREYCWKTAAYTFEGPMLSAAVACGLNPAARDAVSRFAMAIGQAYQLQNDLFDLATPCHAGSDLVQGKRTFTLVSHRAQLGLAARERLDRQLQSIAENNGQALALAEELRGSLLAEGAAKRTVQLIASLLRDAADAGHDPSLPRPFRDGLAGLLGSLKQDYFRFDPVEAAAG